MILLRPLARLLTSRINQSAFIRNDWLEGIVSVFVLLLPFHFTLLLLCLILSKPINDFVTELILLRYLLIQFLGSLIQLRLTSKVFGVLAKLLHLLRIQSIHLRKVLLVQLLTDHLRLLPTYRPLRR